MSKSFCQFVQNTNYEDIPNDVLSVMRRSLLDTIGVAVIGSQTDLSSIVKKFTAMQMPCGENTPAARTLFGNQTTSPMGAAMAGAFSIDSIDAHDGYSAVKGHAGSAVLPGVLSIIDSLINAGKKVSGRDLILALSIGYEVAYRAGLTQHATTPDYHTSGTWTAVGVAAAGARLLGLSDDKLRHAVGIAEYHAPRSQMMRCIDHPTMLRDGVGWGAPTGVSAVFLAAEGFTGAPAITVESEEANPFWDDLGTRWEVVNTHYKAYPVCRWAHPAIDAVSDLMKEHSLESSQIERTRILTFHYATRLAGHEPKTLDELSYALAYPLAIMAVRGKIGINELKPEILKDPEILRISRATEIAESKHYTEISTRKRWADVTLYLKDGREFQSKPYTPRGDPDNPLSDAEISAKYHLFTNDIIGKSRADEIERNIHIIEREDFNFKAFLDLLY